MSTLHFVYCSIHVTRDCSPIDMIVVNNVMSTALGRKLVGGLFGINVVTYYIIRAMDGCCV